MDDELETSGYSLGMVMYAPNGEISQAVDVKAGDYKNYDYKYTFGSLVGTPLPKVEEDMYFYQKEDFYSMRPDEDLKEDDEIIQIVADHFGVTFEEVEEAYNKSEDSE